MAGILISGLRRSGTTIFWETLRQHRANLCFDEPFHPELWVGRRQNEKGTWTELGDYVSKHPMTLVRSKPITPRDEIERTMDPGQVDYLRRLFCAGDRVVVDTVRMWSKLSNFPQDLGGVLIIHLIRDPKTWVSAHLLPSSSINESWKRRLSNTYRRNTFFSRQSYYDNWHYEEIVNYLLSANRTGRERWNAAGLEPDDLRGQPAYVKLLAFWKMANLETSVAIEKFSNANVLTIKLEDFVQRPGEILQKIYSGAGWDLDEVLDFSMIKPLRKAWKDESPLWEYGMRKVGLSEPSNAGG